MTVPTVNMIAPSTFGGIVEGTPSGTVYTGTPGSVVAALYADITTLAALGFTPASNSASQNALVTGTVAASPATMTNANGYPEVLSLNTGIANVSALSFIRNGITTTIGTSWPGPLRLSPGDGVKITWATAAPTYAIVPG